MTDAVLNQFTPGASNEEKIDATKRVKVGIIGTGLDRRVPH